MPAIPCPACQSPRTVAVADHYATQVRLPDADPTALAPLAPPVRRSILAGTLCLTLFWMAALGPGFVAPGRALTVVATFGGAGALALWAWLRARKADRARMAEYQKARLCLACGTRY